MAAFRLQGKNWITATEAYDPQSLKYLLFGSCHKNIYYNPFFRVVLEAGVEGWAGGGWGVGLNY